MLAYGLVYWIVRWAIERAPSGLVSRLDLAPESWLLVSMLPNRLAGTVGYMVTASTIAAFVLWWRAHPHWLRSGVLAGVTQALVSLTLALALFTWGSSRGNMDVTNLSTAWALPSFLLGLLFAYLFARVTLRGALVGMGLSLIGAVVSGVDAIAVMAPTLLAPAEQRRLDTSTTIAALVAPWVGSALGFVTIAGIQQLVSVLPRP
jgi:hypothetical protein